LIKISLKTWKISWTFCLWNVKNSEFWKHTYRKYQCISNVCGILRHPEFCDKECHASLICPSINYQQDEIGWSTGHWLAFIISSLQLDETYKVNAKTNRSKYHSHQETELTKQKLFHLYRHLKM
jgi:hypothetical protein